MIEKGILNLLSVLPGTFPVASKGVAIIPNYKANNLSSSNGYKLDESEVNVGIYLNDQSRTFSEVSFTGYINAESTSECFGVSFSADGDQWSEPIEINSDGTKTMVKYDVPDIPEGMSYVRISRLSDKTAYIGSIEFYTNPDYYTYDGLVDLTIDGETIPGFDSNKTTYIVDLGLKTQNPSIIPEAVDENVSFSQVLITKKKSTIEAVFDATLPDDTVVPYTIIINILTDGTRPKISKLNISIELFRVSTDSQYLDMMFDCPEDYHFTSLMLEVRSFDSEVKEFISQFFDLSEALFIEGSEEKKHWVVRLPLEKLGITYPAIYKGTIKAQLADDYESQDICDWPDQEIEDHMVASDVNQAYKCMLDELMKLEDPCFEISDELTRKYLLLYGHQSALAIGDYETAERYFKLIVNCFNICPREVCVCCEGTVPEHMPRSVKSCNCGRS